MMPSLAVDCPGAHRLRDRRVRDAHGHSARRLGAPAAGLREGAAGGDEEEEAGALHFTMGAKHFAALETARAIALPSH